MELNLSNTQQQKLVINPRFEQRLRLLHMSQHDVRELAEEEFCANPLLEIDAPNPDAGRQEGLPETPGGLAVVYSDDWGPRGDGWSMEGGGQDFMAAVSGDFDTLADYLRFQLYDYALTPLQWDACESIIGALDSRGYLAVPLEGVCEQASVSAFEAEQMLYLVQMLEPAGVGSRDLKECLTLQLAAGGDFNAYTIRIVGEYLDMLARNDIALIASKLCLSVKEAQIYCDAVRALSPIPANGFDTGDKMQHVVPDCTVTANEAGFDIRVNDAIIPRLALNEEYCQMIEQGCEPELSAYLKKMRADAKSLIADLHMRESTLLKVISCIISMQPEFFRDGKSLKPFTISDVAGALGYHASTVSRAINEKYIACTAGTVSLKSLFCTGYKQDGDQSVSSIVVRRKLVEMISREDTGRPLSDEAIRRAFESEGISVARRTIAKYRGELGIAPASGRKRRFE